MRYLIHIKPFLYCKLSHLLCLHLSPPPGDNIILSLPSFPFLLFLPSLFFPPFLPPSFIDFSFLHPFSSSSQLPLLSSLFPLYLLCPIFLLTSSLIPFPSLYYLFFFPSFPFLPILQPFLPFPFLPLHLLPILPFTCVLLHWTSTKWPMLATLLLETRGTIAIGCQDGGS